MLEILMRNNKISRCQIVNKILISSICIFIKMLQEFRQLLNSPKAETSNTLQ